MEKNTDEGASDTALGSPENLLAHVSQVVQCVAPDETIEGQDHEDVLEGQSSYELTDGK